VHRSHHGPSETSGTSLEGCGVGSIFLDRERIDVSLFERTLRTAHLLEVLLIVGARRPRMRDQRHLFGASFGVRFRMPDTRFGVAHSPRFGARLASRFGTRLTGRFLRYVRFLDGSECAGALGNHHGFLAPAGAAAAATAAPAHRSVVVILFSLDNGPMRMNRRRD